jgi:hypothetical protein
LCKKLVVYFFDLLHHKVKEEANMNLSFCIKILFIILQSGWQFYPLSPSSSSNLKKNKGDVGGESSSKRQSVHG